MYRHLFQKLILYITTSILILYFFSLIDFSFHFLKNNQYFEPAENENLVMALFQKNNFHLDYYQRIENGLMSIYPYFFHSIVGFFGDNLLFNARLLNLLLYLILTLLITYINFKNNIFLPIILITPLALYGAAADKIYYWIFRTDGSSFFFGIIGFLIIYFKGNYDLRAKKNTLIYFISAFFCSLSLISKQTGIFFFVITTACIFFQNHSNNFFFLLRQFFIFAISSLLFLGAYFYFDQNSFISLFYGYDLYGTTFNKRYFIILFKKFIFTYSFLYFFTLFLIFYIQKKLFYKKVEIYLMIIVLFFSIKLFGNSAADTNSFNFIDTLPLIIIFKLISFIKIKEKLYFNNIILLILLIKCFYFQGSLKKIFYLNYFPTYLLENKFDDDIFKKIKELDRTEKVLTERLDNYLFFSKKEIFYEGSVLTSAMFVNNNKSFTFNQKKIHLALSSKRNQMFLDINDKKFDYILLGINDQNFRKTFTNFDKNYKKIMTKHITQGFHTFYINLYKKI